VYKSSPISYRENHIDIGTLPKFKLPECDLRAETLRAMQPGDSVDGMLLLQFKDYLKPLLDKNLKLRISATDILERQIRTVEVVIGELPTTTQIFSCPLVEDK